MRVQRGGRDRAGPRSCVFLGGARHAAHHRNVSTRPEIKCLSNDTHGGSQPNGLCNAERREREREAFVVPGQAKVCRSVYGTRTEDNA